MENAESFQHGINKLLKLGLYTARVERFGAPQGVSPRTGWRRNNAFAEQSSRPGADALVVPHKSRSDLISGSPRPGTPGRGAGGEGLSSVVLEAPLPSLGPLPPQLGLRTLRCQKKPRDRSQP